MKLKDRFKNPALKRPDRTGTSDLEELKHLEEELKKSCGELEEKIQERSRELQESYSLLQAIIDNSPAVIYFKDTDGRLLLVNNEFARIFHKEKKWLIGKTDYDNVPKETADSFRKNDLEVMNKGVPLKYEETLFIDGELRTFLSIKFPLRNAVGVIYGIAGISTDITELKKAEEIIKYQAYHDLLTGLPNRALFTIYLDLEIAQARRNEKKLAVLFLDLDRFKSINDSLGHAIGDQVIKDTAVRLNTLIRESDTLAHLGGDEFTVLLADIIRAEDAVPMANAIMAAMRSPFILNSHELYTTASIGISICPDDGEDPEALLRNADIAMSQAKKQGGNNYQFFNPAVNVRTVERLLLENRLRQTLERGELAVYYQPQVNIGTRQIQCFEALVRWRHPELGVLSPSQFIPVAEEIGFISSIDQWVLRTACIQNKLWQDSGLPSLRVTVNLSAPEFLRPDLIDNVAQVLQETGLDPKCLDIEITESTAIQDIELAVPNMGKLSDMGVNLSIDDFGTGYSSLSYLKRFPVQKLKIDQSFIRDVANDPGDQAIVNAVIAMGHSLKLRVVAEGVENEDQLSFLRSSNCDEIQGFLVSKPLPAERFDGLAEEKTAR